MAVGDNLSEAQAAEARRLWAEGRSLGAIADALGCSVYDLSPWLYAEEMRAARDAARGA